MLGSQQASNTSQISSPPPQFVIGPPTAEEEDSIILARITNDERPLRRVLKKFHNYAALSHSSPTLAVVATGNAGTSVSDAREAFLVELASFQLSLKKNAMICEAEARQVEEYQREKERIDEEHGKLRGQIEQLKIALEFAQTERRRKIEYDLIAGKVNTLPSREELEQTIQSLENDMAAIQSEHETQNRTIQGQKFALDNIILELGSLRFMGKDQEAVSVAASPTATPVLDGLTIEDKESTDNAEELATPVPVSPNEKEDDGEVKETLDSLPPSSAIESGVEDDIEMGEVEEDPKDKARRNERELEEGEASDSSSELSDPPDD